MKKCLKNNKLPFFDFEKNLDGNGVIIVKFKLFFVQSFHFRIYIQL